MCSSSASHCAVRAPKQDGLTSMQCSGSGAVSFKKRDCIIDSDAHATARVHGSLQTDRVHHGTHLLTTRDDDFQDPRWSTTLLGVCRDLCVVRLRMAVHTWYLVA